MPGNILKSSKAIRVRLLLVRAFVRLWKILFTHKELAHKPDELEREVGFLVVDSFQCMHLLNGIDIFVHPFSGNL